MQPLRWLLLAACMSPWLLSGSSGHGRLIEPPSRGTMWRYGFDSPPDYNDHELYCGGFSRQWNKNGGKCGICGDAWDTPRPRAHEAGGKYGQGVIVRRYKRNSAITIRIELTANHKGYFEFRVCPNNSPKQVGSQQCLDKYVLSRAKPTGMNSGKEPDSQPHDTRYFPGEGNRIFETRYQLPQDLSCTQCVLQWRYVAGNNWGKCDDGTEAVGCGPQEEFRACADVAIVDSAGSADETPYIDNEIPGETNRNEQDEGEEIERVEYWLLMLIIVLSLVTVSVILALVYLYYYHAGDSVKKWMSVDRFRKVQPQPPIPPPRTKKQPC